MKYGIVFKLVAVFFGTLLGGVIILRIIRLSELVRFDATIALGSMIHLVCLLTAIIYCFRGTIRHLSRVENKQDKLLANLKGRK